MSQEEELKVRAQAEAAALSSVMQLLMSNYVTQAGEIAVLRAKEAENKKEPAA